MIHLSGCHCGCQKLHHGSSYAMKLTYASDTWVTYFPFFIILFGMASNRDYLWICYCFKQRKGQGCLMVVDFLVMIILAAVMNE